MGVRSRRMTGTDRDKLWTSIRILRRFSLPDVVRTSGAAYDNAKKFVRSLQIHGYIAETGPWTSGRPGVFKIYRLVMDSPKRPVQCERCGRPVSDAICEVGHE